MTNPHERAAITPLEPEYLTAEQVTQLTGFTLKALEAMRARGRGPRYLKIGSCVRYRLTDVRSWIEGGAR
jgi:predicted DNA-binding transcriptional regulator AlpA